MITTPGILDAKILIVDDMEANVLLLEGMLRVAGYTSVQSTTDPTAVAGLHKLHCYSLILLDLHMPVMDGFEVLGALRAIETNGYLPVLVVTAQPQHKLRALEDGARDFVSKPFDLAELSARVRNILEVRLLHLAAVNHVQDLAKLVHQLETSREVVRLKTMEESKYRAQELALAGETQKCLLPRYVPQFENYRINAYNNPTGQLGANFYDFQQVSETHWMGVLADVSGKGVSSALFSSMVLGALSMEFRSKTEPGEVLNRVNKLLCEKSLPWQFVTLFLFLLSPEGTGQFISAGHTPTYLFRAATGLIEELFSEEYMLGMFTFTSYRPRKFYLNKGDVLLVYSDGLTNAENADRKIFGKERLLEIIQQEAGAGGKALEKRLLLELENFTQGTAQPDDITYLIIEKYQ